MKKNQFVLLASNDSRRQTISGNLKLGESMLQWPPAMVGISLQPFPSCASSSDQSLDVFQGLNKSNQMAGYFDMKTKQICFYSASVKKAKCIN